VPPDPIRILIDRTPVLVPPGTTVAAAMLHAGADRFHDSVGGSPRGPVCGMGTCFECVVTIDRRRWVRSCLVECVEGMEVSTHERNP
jgi:D-hydroxyproline dehydrogenase subunit gamma